MNWFLVALITPIAHGLVNHFDKYLVSRFTKDGTVGSLVIFSALFSIFALPIILLIHPSAISSVGGLQAAALMLNGALLVGAIILYLYALETDEASYVAPMFQLIPVFGAVLGFLVLDEAISQKQLLAAVLIVLGSLLLSLEIANGSPKLKGRFLALMTGSSLLYAISAVVFKDIASQQGFLDSLFWDMLGKVGIGIVLFALVRPYRQQFVNVLKSNRFTIIGLNALNEILALIGEVATVFAVLLAPVVLVQSVGGLQPLFVLAFGIVITKFFPKIGRESLERKSIIQKVFGIVIITVGVYMLEIVKR